MAAGERPRLVLGAELATFEHRSGEPVGRAEGRCVLITGGDVASTHESQIDAIAEGYRRYGSVPFLVKRFQGVDVPATFVPNLFGV